MPFTPGAAILRLVATALVLFLLPIAGVAGQLDDYYLRGFGVQSVGSELQKAVLFQSSASGETPHCGTPLKHGLSRDWKKLEPATQKVLAKQLAAPVLSGGETTFLSASGRFLIHYTTSGSDAVPSIDWVQTVAQTFDDVANAYLARGWRLPPTISAAPYDVYLLDLSRWRLYGQTTSSEAVPSGGYSNAFASFIEIDNNFTDSIYTTSKGKSYTPTQSLQVTAAHEYHHAIQYGYNYFFDIWYAEATSTWFEDELYDGVNQLYNYVASWFSRSTLSLDTTTDDGYSRWIFNRYLAEQHGTGVIKATWDSLVSLNSPGNNADIPMEPVLDSVLSTSYSTSLGSEFFGFARRVYQRDWTSHTGDTDLIHPYSPVSVYSSYPASTTNATLPHNSFAYYQFLPSSTSADYLNITVKGSSGIKAAAFIKSSAGTITEYPFSGVDGITVTIPGFSTSGEVVLLVANTSDVDNLNANFSTDATAQPPPVTEPGDSNSSSSGGGGCFIATAAYGSYLHPQVRILRNFRDNFLLTNAPGRAFVALYYSLSPRLADFIARHELLRGMTRVALTPFVLTIAYPAYAGSAFLLFSALFFLPLRRRFQSGKVLCKK